MDGAKVALERDPCERGVALVVILMAILFLMALGLALVLNTSTEALIAANYRTSQAAFYAAEAGIERALPDLGRLADWSQALSGAAQSSFVDGPPAGARPVPGGGEVDPMRVRNLLNCRQEDVCTPAEMDAIREDRPWGFNNPRWTLYAYGPLEALLPPGAARSPFYVIVLVADDPAENDNDPTRDGTLPGNPGAGVLRLRAEALGPGGTRRAFEVRVARDRVGDVLQPASFRLRSWREIR
jgi:PilX N-terminal